MSLLSNTKVTFNYEILEKMEAGIELLGSEVKSIRMKQGSLDGSYVKIYGGEAFLTNADIPPYQAANAGVSYDRHRARKLLLSKMDILSLEHKTTKERLTLIPISMYNKQSKIKVELALARGKKARDKRESIKKRESNRDIRRTLKTR